MQTFYFHLKNGHDVLADPEGRQLLDLESARAIAVLEARAIIAADVMTGVMKLSQQINVEDAAGHILHSLQFSDAFSIE